MRTCNTRLRKVNQRVCTVRKGLESQPCRVYYKVANKESIRNSDERYKNKFTNEKTLPPFFLKKKVSDI